MSKETIIIADLRKRLGYKRPPGRVNAAEHWRDVDREILSLAETGARFVFAGRTWRGCCFAPIALGVALKEPESR